MKKQIAIIGSTGSIGVSTLRVARHLNEKIKVVGLAAASNWQLLDQQLSHFQPELVALLDRGAAAQLQIRHPKRTILSGKEGIEAVAAQTSADMVVIAVSGMVGLLPTLAALQAKKDIALANKEALVAGGKLVTSLAKKMGVRLLPVDSEHNAIFQCLDGEDPATVNRLILTASGGPFRNFTEVQLQNVTPAQALKHPNWKMGPKVTVDSSTLMNKGLEVIEAYWLFGLPISKIEVIIHPQSIIHSMVEFVDYSILAQLGVHDMVFPIQYALTYPQREPASLPGLNFHQLGSLEFYSPDTRRFRCLDLAYQAIREGGSLPCYMNGVNEELVKQFLEEKISWQGIGEVLEKLMLKHENQQMDSLEAVVEIDQLARADACEALKSWRIS